MARKKTSASPLDAEKPRPYTKPVSDKEREKRREEAAKVALLQLTLGRTAQIYSIYSALALALNAFLAAGSQTGFSSMPIFQSTVLWLVSLIVGLVLSAFVVIQKWDPFVAERRSAHFILSVVAVVLSIIGVIIVLLHATGQFVLSYTAWLYPVSVLPIALMLMSLAATWEGSGRRKVTSIFCAAVLPIFLIFTMTPGAESSASFNSALVVAYLFGALSAQLSGSMLLIIATATDAHEREIVKAGDTQFNLLREEYEGRRQALDYKEKALRAQEMSFAAREQELRDYEDEIAEKTKTTQELQLKADTREKQLRDAERQLSVMKADLQAKTEELALRNKAFQEREDEAERFKDQIKDREMKNLEREKELKKQEIDVTDKLKKAERIVATAKEVQDAIKIEEQALDKRREDAIQKEKDLELRESELQMKIEELEAVLAQDQETKVKEIKDWETKVLTKERELGKLDVELRKMDKEVKSKSEALVREDARLQEDRLLLSDKENAMLTKEKQLSDLETTLVQRAQQVEQQFSALSAAKKKLEAKEAEYAEMFRSVKENEAVAASSQEDLKRAHDEVEAERRKAKVISENLSKEIRALNERNKQMAARQAEFDQKESDIQLRMLELDRREKSLARAPSAGVVSDEERDKVLDVREKRMREREEEFRRRTYQKEKELEAKEAALREKERTLKIAAGEEVAPEKEKAVAGEKIRTGIPRLDDLLYGGLHMNANILLVGPAFVGKEVVAYNFVAEGLKKGQPAIIVTTTKPPVEIAKDLAPILPSFMEYEQLGLVKWIDASGGLPAGSKPKRSGSVYQVNGATDYDALLDVVDLLDTEFKEKKHASFRLAYVTLSSSTTHTEENKAVNFVQQLVNRLRQTKAVSFMTLERGMHTDTQIETLEHLMDGAIFFKVEGNKNVFSVIGLGDVQTRDWVRYKFNNKTLIIGAFALERIK